MAPKPSETNHQVENNPTDDGTESNNEAQQEGGGAGLASAVAAPSPGSSSRPTEPLRRLLTGAPHHGHEQSSRGQAKAPSAAASDDANQASHKRQGGQETSTDEQQPTRAPSKHHHQHRHQHQANKTETPDHRQHKAEDSLPPVHVQHVEPKIVIHHHHHRPGQMVHNSRPDWQSSQLLPLKGDQPLSEPIEPSYSDRLAGCVFILGLPLLACAIVMLLISLIFKHCRGLGQKKAASYGDKKSGKSSKRHDSKKSADSVSSSSSSSTAKGPFPIGFISGGKVIDSLKGIHIIGKEGSDGKKLTLNMDEWNADDSDDLAAAKRSGGPEVRLKKFNAGNQKMKHYGRLNYRLGYDFNESMFSVTILRADNLPAMDLNGFSDPYVKVYLTPEKRNYYKTRIHRKSLNPTFNETFQFRISYATLMGQTLVMAVYDYDRFSKHDEIGQVTIPINSIDLAQIHEKWTDLRRIVDSDNGQLGEICLSLRYVPTASKLTIVIMEARKLKKMDMAGLSDPYVKLALMSQGKRLKKKKTSIKKCTLNPHYNESFSFEIHPEQIKETQLALTVVDYDRIGTSEPIGKVVLGCEGATGESELRHWMDMLASPRRPIAQWHSLKAVNFDGAASEASSLD